MPQRLAVQKPDGIYLEQVNPYPVNHQCKYGKQCKFFSCASYWTFEANKQSNLTDDPTVKVGDKVNEEEYELQWQYQVKDDGIWVDGELCIAFGNELTRDDYRTRQILRRKAEGEKETELNGWISVDSKLPKSNVQILLYAKREYNNDNEVFQGWYTDLGDHGYFQSLYMREDEDLLVMFWQPLPNPPKSV